MKLEDLKPDTRLRGIDPAGEVKLLHVEALGADAVTVTYTRASGGLGQDTLFRADEARVPSTSASRSRRSPSPSRPASSTTSTSCWRSRRARWTCDDPARTGQPNVGIAVEVEQRMLGLGEGYADYLRYVERNGHRIAAEVERRTVPGAEGTPMASSGTAGRDPNADQLTAIVTYCVRAKAEIRAERAFGPEVDGYRARIMPS